MTVTPATRRSGPARMALGAISFYQAAFASDLPRCRYLPTCSAYAQEAIVAHGALKGSWLAMKRIGRCHPLGGHGYDPVPLLTPNLKPSDSSAEGYVDV